MMKIKCCCHRLLYLSFGSKQRQEDGQQQKSVQQANDDQGGQNVKEIPTTDKALGFRSQMYMYLHLKLLT